MMSEHVHDALDRYRTGELTEHERARVAAHLDSCEACASALAELESFAAVVARGYDAERALRAAPDWDRMREHIVAGTASRPARPPVRWLRYAPQAAAAVLAVIAVGVLWQQGVEGPTDADRALAPASEASRTSRFDDRRAGDRAATPQTETEAPALADAEPAEPGIAGAEPTVGERAQRKARAGGRIEEARQRAAAPAPADEALEMAPDAAGQDRDVVGAARPAEDDKLDANEAQVSEERMLEDGGAAVEREEAYRANAPVAVSKQGVSVVDRFEREARAAFANRDTAAARAVRGFYFDSIAGRQDLDPDRLAVARAWADSLAVLLAAQP